jgi:hypothetical protein
MIKTWISEYPKITAKLMDYGWFVAPFIAGAEFKSIQQLSNDLDANPPKNDADRQAIEKRIYEALMDVSYSNQVRARYVWLGLQTPNFNEYSHLYEAAIFSYYKRDYSSSVLLLLSTLEGVVLSLHGWKLGQPGKPKFKDLIRTISSIRPFNFNADLNAIQDIYRDAFSTFISKWIYSDTSSADFSLSVLNRHYVLHGMEPGNFYRPVDVHRLLLAFDLLIDLVSMSHGIFFAMVPDEETRYSLRNDYYTRLRSGAVSVREAADLEQQFLSQHPNYVPPVSEPFRLYFGP